MQKVSIREAKLRLSLLIDQAVNGDPFVITKAGKPLVKVVPLNAETQRRRLGFLAGELSVPDDFDQMRRKEIEHQFNLQR